MIQALQNLPTEVKATEKGAVKGDEALSLEGELESAEFTNELLAALSGEIQTEVAPVQVPAEQMLERPTTILNAPAPQMEAVHPKVFDPGLTKGVEKLNAPQAKLTPEQLLKLQSIENPKLKAEIAEAMLKSQGTQVSAEKVQAPMAGRAPAIDFAKAEIDPQLMNNEDFVLQRNAAAKKNVQAQAYGMNKGAVQKLSLENGLKPTQIVKDPTAIETSNPINSQQFILNLMNNNEQPVSPKVNDVQAPVKVFDMSNIKSTNADQIMNQISDYIVQAKAAKEPTVSMRVNHDDLGTLDITVQKTQLAAGTDAVAINIGAHTADGKNFFQSNSKELFSHLSTQGVTVADFKVDTSSQTSKNDFDMGQSSQRQAGQEKQFGSEQNQRRHESERRQNLWDQFRDKDAA